MADPVFTLMIDPVSHCNMRCRYCYLENRNSGRIPVEVLTAAFEKTAGYMNRINCRNLHIIWHGGEPLLAGLDFFKQSFSLIQRFFPLVNYSIFIQTNGLVLDKELACFFRAQEIHVGISLDGPKEIHDALRCSKNGGGTWEIVMEKIGMMETLKLPFGICKTLTSFSLGREKNLYDFFLSLGHPVKVNPMIPSWKKDRALLLSPGEYGKFMNRLMDVWLEGGIPSIRISPLDNYLGALMGETLCECRGKISCTRMHLGIKPDGRAVLCSPFDSITLGNIQEDSIETLYSDPVCLQIDKRLDGLEECLACRLRHICNGGCPHFAKAFGYSIRDKDPFCRDYKMIFSHLRHILTRDQNLC